MVRSPSLIAAGLVLAAPTALPAQPNAMPQVEAASVIEAADACRRAPLDFAGARDHARREGFGDLPADVRARMPYTTLTRRDVRLILIPGTMLPGSCKVYGEVGAIRFADVLAQLSAAFGPAVKSEEGRADWWLEDRTMHASLNEGTLGIDVIFQSLERSEMNAGARPSRPPPPMAALQPPVAMKLTASANDIAAAAAACMGALSRNGIDSAAMERSGWPLAEMTGEAHVHSRDGSNVRIITTAMGGGQCIVDAYGESMDSFDSIRDAVRTRLGSRAKLGSATGGKADFSRGQGFLLGDRIGVLSSERRADGLSIRFTAMSLR